MGRSLELVAKAICEHYSLGFIEFAGEGAFKETYHVEDLKEKSQALRLHR